MLCLVSWTPVGLGPSKKVLLSVLNKGAIWAGCTMPWNLLYLLLNLGLPCQISRALCRLCASIPPNHTMLGTAYPQTFGLYIKFWVIQNETSIGRRSYTNPLLGIAKSLLHLNQQGSSSFQEPH